MGDWFQIKIGQLFTDNKNLYEIFTVFLTGFLTFILYSQCIKNIELMCRKSGKSLRKEVYMEYCLETEGLSKSYRHFKALGGLNMHVPKGSIYGFVGRNGAGKTTLIRIIAGLQEPTSGSYTLYGCRNDAGDIRNARKRMGAVVETPSIYLDMTARENLMQQYRILGMPSSDGIDELLELVGLSDTGKKKAKNFSLGMRQRLGIAIALCGNPDFLVLDEPVNGLDPRRTTDLSMEAELSRR